MEKAIVTKAILLKKNIQRKPCLQKLKEISLCCLHIIYTKAIYITGSFNQAILKLADSITNRILHCLHILHVHRASNTFNNFCTWKSGDYQWLAPACFLYSLILSHVKLDLRSPSWNMKCDGRSGKLWWKKEMHISKVFMQVILCEYVSPTSRPSAAANVIANYNLTALFYFNVALNCQLKYKCLSTWLSFVW